MSNEIADFLFSKSLAMKHFSTEANLFWKKLKAELLYLILFNRNINIKLCAFNDFPGSTI